MRIRFDHNSVTSFLNSLATVAREWTFPDKDITVAGLDDLALKADLVAGKVPVSQLPSYVDDVIGAVNFAALPGVGETDKIYVTLDNNLTFRWSGSAYVEISASLALGETSGTAYRGDRGKTAYDHSQIVSGNPHGTVKGDVGLGNVDNTSDANKPVSGAAQTALNLKVDESNKQQFILVMSLRNFYNY